LFFEGDGQMADGEKVRPIYRELQGYLSQAPSEGTYIGAGADEQRLWQPVNNAIDELNQVTGEDYSRFKISCKTRPYTGGVRYSVEASTYRTKLSGLISRLYGRYFSDEQPPFQGGPSTVISQTQQQSQSFRVELLLQIQSKIDEQLSKLEPRDKKRGFLEKVKGALKSVRDTAALIALILATAKDSGMTIDELLELFT